MTGDSYRPSTHSHSQSQLYTPTYRHHHSRTGSTYSSHGAIAAPPQASIHPGPGARRRSDYIEHTGQSYSGSASTSPSIQSTGTTPQPQQQYYTSPPLPASNSMTPSISSIASPRPSIDYPQAHALAKVPVPMPPQPWRGRWNDMMRTLAHMCMRKVWYRLLPVMVNFHPKGK